MPQTEHDNTLPEANAEATRNVPPVTPPPPAEPPPPDRRRLPTVGAPLGPGRCDEELALGVVERSHHSDLLGLCRRRNAQVGAALGPGAGKIGCVNASLSSQTAA